MRVMVRLFGPQAAMVGRREVELAMEGPEPTCGEVLERLGEVEPALANSLPNSRLAVNHAFADPHVSVQPGDEVALVGMVAGG